MRCLALLALGAAVGTSGAVAAAQAPRFPKNMRYELARESLLANGWTPNPSDEPRDCNRPDMCNERQPEVLACDGTGFDRCTAVWRNGETVIHITTWGRSPPMVDRVECKAKCR